MQNYFYDLHDQLIKAEIFKKDGSKETWHYVYDALGRRTAKYRELSDGLEEVTEFVWDGSHLLQEVYGSGRYTYIYTDVDSYEPLAQIHNYTNEKHETYQEVNYFHCDQIGIPREMTDKDGRLLWFGEYKGWGKLESETNITGAHQPFRLQNQYFDCETGLHYNFFRYYEPEAGRFVNQDPIGLEGGENFYQFALNSKTWIDSLGLSNSVPIQFGKNPNQIYHTFRHTDELGLDREHVKQAVTDDLSRCTHQVQPDKPFNRQIQVDGVNIQYTAFRLKDGTLNIGRIHGV